MSNIPKCCVFVFHIFCFNNIFLHFVLKTSIIFCNICYKVRLSRPLILAPSFISWKFRTYHQYQVIGHNEGMVLVTFIDNCCHIFPFFNLFSLCTLLDCPLVPQIHGIAINIIWFSGWHFVAHTFWKDADERKKDGWNGLWQKYF